MNMPSAMAQDLSDIRDAALEAAAAVQQHTAAGGDAAERLYSTDDVVRLTGASYRQVDYWIRCEHLTPTQPARGSGSERRFNADQVQTVYFTVELSRAGFKLPAAVRIAKRLVADGGYSGRIADILDLTITIGRPDGES